ncbi:isoprenyl transferase [Hyphobacterium sp. HN65]|uniref:Isoprenyl transferase n=1 Tax=Hyphobacterium lacteum TaxID=3116575 RepID=A0ABU7LLU0_9PROT|nr:isoprenyl transferase [Hyphobacterium sp. HN65]MEE2524895.1 isoprenyl transferase [Hyphobacterium sp. HN65]
MAEGENKCRGVRHVAIIMDGNGRWAQQRNRPRAFGHSKGVEAVREAVRAAGDLGVKYLTLFGFSTENWRRPSEEVDALFDLMKRFVDADLAKLDREGVNIRIAGRREGLSADLLEIVERAEKTTEKNDRCFLTIAFNYGGRDEVVRATRRIAREVSEGRLDPGAITEETFASHLDTAGMPDPDLVIRTSGEHRTSNFLIWQAAYAELVFLDVLWPDFRASHFEQALAQFAARQRRFGGVDAA